MNIYIYSRHKHERGMMIKKARFWNKLDTSNKM